MSITSIMNLAVKATAYDTDDGPHWLTFRSSDGCDVTIFMPFEKAEAIAAIFNAPVPSECWSYDGLNFDTEADAIEYRENAANSFPGDGHEDRPIRHWVEVMK